MGGDAIPGGERSQPGHRVYYFLNHICYHTHRPHGSARHEDGAEARETTAAGRRLHRKGRGATLAGCDVPRISTSTRVCGAACSRLTKASAIPTRRLGDIVPLVTRPIGVPVDRTAHPCRGIPRSSMRTPTSRG